MRGRSARVYLTAVAIILGFLLVMQLRTQGRIAKSLAAQSATDQATMISNLYESNLNLRQEVDKLRLEMEDYDQAIGQSDLAAMARELAKLRIVNGMSEVTGPGVQLTLSADLKPEDLQDLINELRNAGAEAIGLNGNRVVVKTSVSLVGTTIHLDGNPIGRPYVLVAIGQTDTLERALIRKGGLVTYLQTTYPNATVVVLRRVAITLPAYQKGYGWQSAMPVK